ncbi:hypothetical protein ACL07V_37150 [Streptomyces sp. MB22_4]|uniref:hypothetical protein n=1 Tax=Streptomyces sp. MB22_4 TaxID=3383120 RepID=UPI0039A13FAA
MTAQGGALSARAWDIILSCPRPKPRVSAQQQAWHLEPERVRRTVEAFFPQGSSLTLTARTVRLRTKVSGNRLDGAPGYVERSLTALLQCLYFETGDHSGGSLPSPVRIEIVERTEQTTPSEGDQSDVASS